MAKKSEHGARNVIAGCVGNVLEWYDFALYGFFAPIIAKLFFPADNQLTGLLATFGIFAVGFGSDFTNNYQAYSGSVSRR